MSREQNEPYRWARLIEVNNWKEVCEEAVGNSYMEEVKEEMKKISQDEKERYLYLREAMALSDEASRKRIRCFKNSGKIRLPTRENGRYAGDILEIIRNVIIQLPDGIFPKKNLT